MNIYKLSLSSNKQSTHQLKLDGSKSISNRLLLLNEILNQNVKILNLSKSDDTVLMQKFIRAFQNKKQGEIFQFDVQNAGTVSRFITAFLATQSGTFRLTCSEEMKRRPIQILVCALRKLGAHITYLEQDGFLPILIQGKTLTSSKIEIEAGVSSQYISALMMIAPKIEHGLTIQLIGEVASKPYLELTKKLMQNFGCQVKIDKQMIYIQNQKYTNTPSIIVNESDWSAAAFYYAICSMNAQQTIQLNTLEHPLKSAQGDSDAVNQFQSLAVSSSFENNRLTIKQQGTIIHNQEVNFLSIPDMVPAYVIACAAQGVSRTLTGVRNLAIKESNRLMALQKELKQVGVSLKPIDADTWEQHGQIDETKLNQTIFKTYGDHRLAMAFACFGFKFTNVQIQNPEVVSKSYPNFWEDMKKIGLKIEERKI